MLGCSDGLEKGKRREGERERECWYLSLTQSSCVSAWADGRAGWHSNGSGASAGSHEHMTLSLPSIFSFLSPFPWHRPSPHSLSTSSAHSTARPHLSVQEEAPIWLVVRGWVQQWWMMEEMNKWPSDLMHVSGANSHCANSQHGDHPQLLWAFQINLWTHKCVSLCKGRAGGFSRTHADCRL